MSDKKIYKEQPDDFSELIRRKVENHILPVDDDCWNEIELRLKPKRNKVYLWLASSVAAVAVIIMGILLLPESKTPAGTATGGIGIDSTYVDNKAQIQSSDSATIKPEQIAPTKISSRKIDKAIASKESNSNKKQENEPEMHVISDSLNLANNENITPEPDHYVQDSVAAPKGKTAPSLDNKKAGFPFGNKAPERLLIAKKERHDDKWLLAASVSSGRNVTLGNGATTDNYYNNAPAFAGGSESMYAMTAAAPAFAAKNNEILATEDFSDIDHSLPLSFGLTVRKDFNKRIGIETGLIYTYLSSTFRRSTTPYFQAKQELHYLGVPLNIVVYLWNDPKWNVYVSGGGMAEKGLQYKYSQDMYQNDNKTSTIGDKGSVDGLQWSLNGSLGISYSLYQNWGLYVEPRFSYYFDNSQPTSIRTEKPQVFGIGGGLRYKF